MKKLIFLLFLIIPSFLMAQVRVKDMPMLKTNTGILPTRDLTFTGTVDLSTPYYTSYAEYTVATALAISVSATKLNGSSSIVVLVGDGNSAHVPTFTGLYKVGSTSYSYTAGARNIVTFVCVSTRVYFTINQAVLQ